MREVSCFIEIIVIRLQYKKKDNALKSNVTLRSSGPAMNYFVESPFTRDTFNSIFKAPNLRMKIEEISFFIVVF
jgi:hypothetical protein